MGVERCEIPAGALLGRYQVDGTYADCYATLAPGRVDLPRYVEAFYTTPLFRLERMILALAGLRSTDDQARELAAGARDRFAAWTVEDRADDQLLLCDVYGRTRSWLMVSPHGDAESRLYFGSAVVPRIDRRTGEPTLGGGYSALLGFHKLYSVALLGSARRRLAR